MIQQFKTISEAWFNVNKQCMDNGFEYLIERGSFQGHYRKQLPSLAFEITSPELRPLGVEFKGRPFSTDNEIESYFIKYLITPSQSCHESYTYANRLLLSMNEVVDILRKTPNSNQAVSEVGIPEDILLSDPPCLRLCSFKVVNGKLNLTSFWRSWDVTFGLSMNLGGLQRLNETIAEMSRLQTGSLICYSDGAHIYDYNYRIFLD